MSKPIKITLITIGILVVLQVGTFLIFSFSQIPSIALRLTPEQTHFSEDTTFSWVWLQADLCRGLTEEQNTRLRSLLADRYPSVYDAVSEIPEKSIDRDSDGNWIGYDDGFSFSYSVVSRGLFWVRIGHCDRVGNLGASSGEHVYVWILYRWFRLYDDGMALS